MCTALQNTVYHGTESSATLYYSVRRTVYRTLLYVLYFIQYVPYSTVTLCILPVGVQSKSTESIKMQYTACTVYIQYTAVQYIQYSCTVFIPPYRLQNWYYTACGVQYDDCSSAVMHSKPKSKIQKKVIKNWYYRKNITQILNVKCLEDQHISKMLRRTIRLI